MTNRILALLHFFLPLSIVLNAALASAQPSPAPNPQLAAKQLNRRVDALLKKMTLEEKIGQLVQFSAGYSNPTALMPPTSSGTGVVSRGQIGSMLNVVGADATNHYQHIAVEKSRLHIPLIFGQDVIHGHRTTFPVPLALAGELGSRGHRDGGPHRRHRSPRRRPRVGASRPWSILPATRAGDASSNPPVRTPISARRSRARGSRATSRTISSKPDSVAVSVKHYAAYGAAIAGRDYNAVDMGEITLRQVYLEPYRAAVEAGAATMMSSFNSINGVPATANPFMLTQVLRREWGFDGFVVSDWGAVAELKNHSIGDGPTVARKALEAGIDMDMEGNLYGTVIAAQVRSGKIPESVVDEAARRVLRVKFALGLFDHPYTPQARPMKPRRSAAQSPARSPAKPSCCSRTIPSRASVRCFR